MAPEVFLQEGYDEAADWWSVGAILFEMLVGYAPFYDEAKENTIQKILYFEKYLSFPPEVYVPPEAKDLILSLMCRVEQRLDINTIKSHKWFKGMDWDNLRGVSPPWVPDLKNEEDTSNFEKFEEQEAWGAASVPNKKKTKKSGEDQLLPDWTWKVELEEKKQNFINALKGV